MSELLLHKNYTVMVQELSGGYLKIVEVGYVNSLSEAKTMVKIFKDSLKQQGKHATVFFQLADD